MVAFQGLFFSLTRVLPGRFCRIHLVRHYRHGPVHVIEYIYIRILLISFCALKFIISHSLYTRAEASNLEHNAASMPYKNSQFLASNTHIAPSSLLIKNSCSCRVLQLDEAMLPSQHDSCLKHRPNTKWQDLENRRFVDLWLFIDEFVDKEEYEASGEDGNEASDSFNEIPGGDGSNRRSEDEAHHGPHLTCSDPDKLGAMDEAILSTHSGPES